MASPTSQPDPPPTSHGESPGEAPQDGGARKALEVLAVTFLFPIAIYAGYVLGRWVGERFGVPVPGGLVGAAVGAIAGFWELYRFVRRLWPR